MCKSLDIDEMVYRNTWANDKLQQLIRKFRYCRRVITRNIRPNNEAGITPEDPDLAKPGDRVRVRSREEIKRTMNRLGKTRGCTFLPEMFNHCGKEFKVLKKVEHFFDESTHKMVKCSGILLLEGCYCTGTGTYTGRCDRNCFLFWCDNWLEKI
jgi:hypothetical protein